MLGLMTGKCVLFNATDEDLQLGERELDATGIKRSCQIVSWCPLEEDVTPE